MRFFQDKKKIRKPKLIRKKNPLKVTKKKQITKKEKTNQNGKKSTSQTAPKQLERKTSQIAGANRHKNSQSVIKVNKKKCQHAKT